MENHLWTYQRGYAKDRRTVASVSRLIVPEGISGATILDATASTNLVYQLADGKADVVAVPTTARRYDNVILHVSRGHAVGKLSMTKDAKAQVQRLVANLKAALGSDRKVLVACHQSVEPQFLGMDTGFQDFAVGHWNALDGRNDWSDFDTVAIMGLPYMPDEWTASTFFAYQGAQDTRWLNDPAHRAFGSHPDIRKAIMRGHLVTSVVQAINRVRCRRTIDPDGNCLATDVFILLPGGDEGAEILNGIRGEMPGAQVVPWEVTELDGKMKKTDHTEALVSYVRGAIRGTYSATTIRADLNISPRQWERLAATLKDPEADLTQRLTESSARYVVERRGKTQVAFIVKD
jgi:hypothetical protein